MAILTYPWAGPMRISVVLDDPEPESQRLSQIR